MKEALLSTFKSKEFENLPKEFVEKIKDENFLKEKIDEVMKKYRAERELKDFKMKTEVKHVSNLESEPVFKCNRKYAPYAGEALIKNFSDLYHYFPQAGNIVRLWKLRFKDAARRNGKKFEGCANPAELVDWLVPNIEDVKRQDRFNKKK